MRFFVDAYDQAPFGDIIKPGISKVNSTISVLSAASHYDASHILIDSALGLPIPIKLTVS